MEVNGDSFWECVAEPEPTSGSRQKAKGMHPPILNASISHGSRLNSPISQTVKAGEPRMGAGFSEAASANLLVYKRN